MPETYPTGGELFIVDNSDENWKGLRYLGGWTEITCASLFRMRQFFNTYRDTTKVAPLVRQLVVLPASPSRLANAIADQATGLQSYKPKAYGLKLKAYRFPALSCACGCDIV